MVVTEQAQDDAPWSVSWPNLRISLFRDWKIHILPVSMFGDVCWLPTCRESATFLRSTGSVYYAVLISYCSLLTDTQ